MPLYSTPPTTAQTGEDFVMMMRMMKEGFSGVYVTYMDGWAEGVDENVHTNYTNYQKYVNSSCEMILNPTAQWFQKGVFTDLIKEYIFKTPSVPWFVKVQTISYLGTQ